MIYRNCNYIINTIVILLLSLFYCEIQAKSLDDKPTNYACKKNIQITKNNNYKIEVNDLTINKIDRQYFGFNIEWFGFQRSYWSSKYKSINNFVIESLKKDFSGALYRYPGGSVSNRFDWQSSIGVFEERPKQKAVDWYKPIVAEFGYTEYRSFIDQVEGIPWIVNNLQGSYYEEYDIDKLSRDAFELAKISLLLQPNILRWELGNELDRGIYMWSEEKYASRATAIAKSIKQADPNAKFVSILRDHDVEGPGSSKSYNLQLIDETRKIGPEYVLHQYYDSPLGGPSITNRLNHICSNIEEIEKYNSKASIWITEHARAPVKITNKGWKDDYSKTNDLQSAISISDYIIGLTQIPEVKGAFIHSLGKSDGPWTLFHKVNSNIRPSVVYWALQLVRENLLPDVLDVNIESRNDSKYSGGYDFRASVLTNKDRTSYNILMINRSNNRQNITLKLSQLTLKSVKAVVTRIYDKNTYSNNMKYYKNILPVKTSMMLNFDKEGESELQVPGLSISSIFISEL